MNIIVVNSIKRKKVQIQCECIETLKHGRNINYFSTRNTNSPFFRPIVKTASLLLLVINFNKFKQLRIEATLLCPNIQDEDT